MIDVSAIEAELALTTDELYERLGVADGAVFASSEDNRERGRSHYANILQRLRSDLCRLEAVRECSGKGDHGLKVQAIAAVADLIGGQGAVTCAVLIVQAGLDQVCANEWRAD